MHQTIFDSPYRPRLKEDVRFLAKWILFFYPLLTISFRETIFEIVWMKILLRQFGSSGQMLLIGFVDDNFSSKICCSNYWPRKFCVADWVYYVFETEFYFEEGLNEDAEVKFFKLTFRFYIKNWKNCKTCVRFWRKLF